MLSTSDLSSHTSNLEDTSHNFLSLSTHIQSIQSALTPDS